MTISYIFYNFTGFLFCFKCLYDTIQSLKQLKNKDVIIIKKIIFAVILILAVAILASCIGKTDIPFVTTKPAETAPTEPLTVTVTFPEGLTLVQMAEKLEENKVCSASEFIALTNNYEYIQTLGYTFTEGITEPESRAFYLEGYIFPDTYEFYKGESPERALKRFLDNTERKLTAEYTQRAEELGYTLDEIITLASIIQEESYTHESVKNVASVLHNRLSSPNFSRLQCDVTKNYIRTNIDNSPYLTGDTSSFAETYNTYECFGLPIGPITNPGLASIEAALYPAETNYFYFVTDSQWNYYYAETYAQHKANCNKVGLKG